MLRHWRSWIQTSAANWTKSAAERLTLGKITFLILNGSRNTESFSSLKRRIWSGSEIKSRYQLVHEEPVIFLSDVQNRCEACINTRALNRVQQSVIYSHISLKMFEQKFAQNVTKSAHSFFSSYFMLVGVQQILKSVSYHLNVPPGSSAPQILMDLVRDLEDGAQFVSNSSLMNACVSSACVSCFLPAKCSRMLAASQISSPRCQHPQDSVALEHRALPLWTNAACLLSCPFFFLSS